MYLQPNTVIILANAMVLRENTLVNYNGFKVQFSGICGQYICLYSDGRLKYLEIATSVTKKIVLHRLMTF